jgi:thiol-disulfide isomerase/thioredoxin
MKGYQRWMSGFCMLAFQAVSVAQDTGGQAADRFLERFDENGDGVLELKELNEGARRKAAPFDVDGDGRLSRAEMGQIGERARTRERVREGAGPRPGEKNAPPAAGERVEDSLKIGDRAPDFALPLASGEGEITLSEYLQGKPTVLVFGSLTCPPFRSRMLQFDPLYQKYQEKVNFLMVYTREAHPESTIYVNRDGEAVLEKIEQTDDLAERMDHARVCGPTLKFTFPTVVDKEDNRVNEAYAGWPSRFVVVSAEGRLVYDGGPGPWGFQPEALDEWLAAKVGN